MPRDRSREGGRYWNTSRKAVEAVLKIPQQNADVVYVISRPLG